MDTDGRYLIKAQAGDLWGTSDYFTARYLNGHQYHVAGPAVSLNPDYRTYEPGESFTLTVPGDSYPFVVYLAPQGNDDMGIWYPLWNMGDSLRSEPDGGRYQMDLRFPSSVNADVHSWEIVFQNETSGFLRSHTFEIVPGAAASRGHFGGGGGSTTTARLHLASPRAGDNFPDEDVMRHIPLRWIYIGPAGTCPRNWNVRLVQPGHPDRIYDYIRAEDTQEHIPDSPALDHTWTMRRTILLDIPPGEYSLVISAGDFTADSGGTFHLGADELWPELLLINGPSAGSHYFPGDEIEVVWQVRPAPPRNVRLYWPRIRCGDRYVDLGYNTDSRIDTPIGGGARRSRATVTIDPEASSSDNCRIEIVSVAPDRLRSSIRGERFQILRPVRGLDLRVAGVRVREDGHLMASVHLYASFPSEAESSYRVPFFIGHSDFESVAANLQRVIREITVSARLHGDAQEIDLGHINSFINGEVREHNVCRWITVRANDPEIVVPEEDFSNNTVIRRLPVRRVEITCNNLHSLYLHARRGWRESRFLGDTPDIQLTNRGYGIATGEIHLTQHVEARCGELGGRQVLDLGSLPFSLSPARNPESLEHTATYGINGGFPNRPVQGSGWVILDFYGDFSSLGRGHRVPVYCVR